MPECEYSHKRQQWLKHYQASVFSDYQFGEALGLWQAVRAEPTTALLPSQAAFGKLEFSSDQYLIYCEQIRLAQKRYRQLPYLPAILQELNAGIFKHQELEDCLDFVTRNLDDFTQSAQQLQFDYTKAFNRQYNQQRGILRQAYLSLRQSILNLDNAYQPPEANKRTEKKQRQDTTRALWQILTANHQKWSPFSQEWPEKAEKWTLPEWQQWAADYESQLNYWQDNHRNQLRESQIGLSLASVDTEKDSWQALVDRQNELFERLNNTGLFQRPLNAGGGTLLRNQKLLEQLREKLLQLKQLLPVLPDFYHWQRNWFDLPAELRRLVAILMNSPEADWVAAFASWYFEGALNEKIPLLKYPPYASAALKPGAAATTDIHIIQAGSPVPEGDFSAIILLGAAYDEAYKDLPTLQWCPPGSALSQDAEVIYMAQYGQYNPGSAFCQQWSTRLWAKWTIMNYPQSAAEATSAIAAFFNLDKSLATSLVQQKRWNVVVQDDEMSSPRPLNGLELAANGYHKAMVFCTSLAAADDKLTALLPHLWSQAHQCCFMLDISPNLVTNALLSDGFSGPFALAATVRGAEAIQDADRPGWEAMAAEVRKRLGTSEARPHPLLSELLPNYQRDFPDATLSLHHGWRDLHFPLLIKAADGQKTVVLVDDLVPGADTVATEIERRQELAAAGFKIECLLSVELLEEKKI